MSYSQRRQNNSHPQPPLPPRHASLANHTNPYRQQGQNGGYQDTQYAQAAYPGQQAPYDYQQAGGGIVQQSQGGYQDEYQDMVASPTASSFGSYQQPQYSPQPGGQPAYNPARYASRSQSMSQSPQVPAYNPQHYAPQYTASYGQQQQQHEPAYQARSTSGPIDAYGYSPSDYSSNSTFIQPQQVHVQQSYAGQQLMSPTQQHHYSPQPPQHQYGFSPQQNPPPPPPPAGYGYQPPPVPEDVPLQMPYHANPPPLPPRRQTTSHAAASPQPNISPALPGLHDGSWLPSPPMYSSRSGERQSPYYGSTGAPSPPSSTPGPTPPAHSYPSRSNTLDRHPQSRPLPGPPEPDVEPDYFRHHSQRQRTREEEEAISQEDLFTQVEDAVMNAGRGSISGRSPSISVSRPGDQHSPQPLFSPRQQGVQRHQSNGSAVNGHLSPVLAEQQDNDGYESDPEAAAGVAAMQMAEAYEQEGASMHFGGRDSVRSSARIQPNNRNQADDDNDDFVGTDLGSMAGGYPADFEYNGNPNVLTSNAEMNGTSYSQPVSSQHSSMRRSHASAHSSRGEYDYFMDNIHPFPPFNPAARVDAGGTGGLAEPNAHGRRPSYDEGDEEVFMDGQTPPGLFPGEPPDLFYHPSTSPYRPLPPPPEGEMPPLDTNSRGASATFAQPSTPGAFDRNSAGQFVPRSISMISHSNTPQPVQPIRSRTDAEERRIRQQQFRVSTYNNFDSTPASSSTVAIDLPSLPTRRFVPSKLGAQDFKRCEEPWALSSIVEWLRTVTSPDQTAELKEAIIDEALVALFTHKVPTMNIADAEVLSNHVIKEMYTAGTLVTTEEWVKLAPGKMSGVIFQLTGTGCYSPSLHGHVVPGRCYAHHCQRTLKKVDLQAQPLDGRPALSWDKFFGLTKEQALSKGSKELERQNNLHEIVTTEEDYMKQLKVLRELYRDPLLSRQPSIITPNRQKKFVKEVFGKVDAVKQANEDHLLPQLKYRQQEQGPWVVGFSDIFRQWIRKARTSYIDYATGFPQATFLVRQELERNLTFREFVAEVRSKPESNRLGWDTYLKVPITRLQRYSLLLGTVLRNMKEDSEERRNLQTAYDEVKNVTLECDARVAEMQRQVDLSDLGTKLVLRPSMQDQVSLNLNHLGRELIHRGDLQRMGGNRFTWLDAHALLFDHYMVLAKTLVNPDKAGGTLEKYDVSRLPIPMDLLVLESTKDDPVQKSSYVKGITSVTTVTPRGVPVPTDPSGMGRPNSNQGGAPALQHTSTGASAHSLHAVTSLGDKDSDRIMYPFRIKHLGRETYTLFAPTENARRDWCTKIIEAKTKHAAALHAQNAEPFRLRVMADSAFRYETVGDKPSRSVLIPGTPVHRAIKEVEQRFKNTGRPEPICRARVNCATSFTTPYPGKHMVAVGTDFGVFVSEADNPRGWTRTISMRGVTQIAVLEDFNLFLLISEKSLISYHLDALNISSTQPNGASSSNSLDNTRKAPQKLSGSKDVGFFVHGRMKDRVLVFYKKRENLSSTFKVLEPIYQKATEKKKHANPSPSSPSAFTSLFRRGTTDFFRDFDDFYIPTESWGINLFNSSLAVATTRGFETMTLDKKHPHSVPDLKPSHTADIASHIRDQRALSMLRLSEQEFLLVYANCAVYVNKHAEVSRSVVMAFVGQATGCALVGGFLLLFDSDFVEVRNAQNGRLKQIIAGREVKMLDDGGGAGSAGVVGAGVGGEGKSVKVVMQHPEMEKMQIVVELVLNGDMREGD
ncbi:hypothetical protein MBLNU230_g3170t1 [Neophaeotheca triangularis]